MNQLKENFCLHKFSKMDPRLTKLTKLSDCKFWSKLSELYPADCLVQFSKEKNVRNSTNYFNCCLFNSTQGTLFLVGFLGQCKAHVICPE